AAPGGVPPAGPRGEPGSSIVARAQILSPRQVVITGIRVGTAQFIFRDDQDRATVYDVVVQINVTQLKALLAESAPGSEIDVRVNRDALILTGRVTDVDAARRIEQVARLVTPNVHNQMTVAGEQQVLLRCTVAEVSKDGMRQLGINAWMG